MSRIHIYVLFLVSILIFSFESYGQRISGKVLDHKTKIPIENVSIYLTNNPSIGTPTNKKGEFRLQYKFNNNDSITFSIIGYQTKKLSFTYFNKKNNIVLLEKSNNVLEEVSLKKKKKQARIKFQKIATLKSRAFSLASEIVGNKIYIYGGDETFIEDRYAKAEDKAGPAASLIQIMLLMDISISQKRYNKQLFVYDLDNNTYSESKVKLDEVAYHQMNNYNNSLYILGGKKTTSFNTTEYLNNEIQIVDLKNNLVKKDKANPHQAVNFNSFVYKDHLVVLGGSTKVINKHKKVYQGKIHLFNFKSGEWHEIGNMPNPRETSGVLINDEIYLIGGYNDKPSSLIESWNLTNTKWKTEGNLFSGMEDPALTAFKEYIYIYDDGIFIIYNTLEKTLREYRINLTLKSANLHYYNNALYLIGGYRNNQFDKVPSSEIIKIDISEFHKTKINRFKKL